MKKSDLQLLERVFTAEIYGRLPFQSKSKQIHRLCDEGYVEPMTKTFPGRFAVTVKGYALTHAGRFAYCESCADVEESP